MPQHHRVLDLARIPVTSRSRQWRANWIWTPEQTPENTFWHFRGVVHLDQVPAAAQLFVTAETRCRVAERPGDRSRTQAQPWLQYYHRFEVGTFLNSREQKGGPGNQGGPAHNPRVRF